MKRGKIPQAVLERSVLRLAQGEREDVIRGPGFGHGSSVLAFEQENAASFCTRSVYITDEMDLRCALVHVINKLVCAGGKASGVLFSVVAPEEMEEQNLKELMGCAKRLCDEFGLQILGGHTHVMREADQFLVTVTGIGKIADYKSDMPKEAKPNQDLVITKWVGLEGTSRLALIGRERLLKRLPHHMIDRAKDYFLHDGCVEKECRIAIEHGAGGLFALSEGGVFGGLWEFGASNHVGLEIDLRKIPLRQETVEICECFQISPYELMAAGSLLISAKHGHSLVQKLEAAGIPAIVVGRTTDGNDRVLRNEEERRFLEPTRIDSYFQALQSLETEQGICDK